jgi:hypothetical protein
MKTAPRKPKPFKADSPEEKATDFNLLIRIDTKLLGFAFLYMQKGPLPVMYPLEALKNVGTCRAEFDGSMGGVAFVVTNPPVKVSFDPEELTRTVLDFLQRVQRGDV